MTTPRELHRFKAFASIAGAIIAPLCLVVYTKGYYLGWVVGGLMATPCLCYAGYHWYKYKKTPEEAEPPEEAESFDINEQPPEEQIRLSKKAIWVMALVGPFLSILTYYQLNGLEHGTSHSERVWAPVAMLYNLLGFWPAVLCWPIVCAAVIRRSLRRIKEAKAMESSDDA